MKGCVFCDYRNKRMLVYEDRVCYAIISKNPINKYHVLVIPRKHYESFVDMPDKLASHIFLVAKKLSKAVKKVCKPAAVTHTSDDEVSGTGLNLVAHYKLHIIPRFKKDLPKIDWSPLRVKESDEALYKYAENLRKLL